jgi:protein-tyrosine phosphatase
MSNATRSYKILFVCLGYICRSPMAEGIAMQLIQKQDLDGWIVDSAGTSAWHMNEQPDARTLATLANHEIIFTHKSRQLTPKDFLEFDYILVMDDKNMQSLQHVGLPNELLQKVYKLTDFDPMKTDHVPDPYYGEMEDFEQIYIQLERTITAFIHALSK